MEPTLLVIGLNHRTAPVAMRERFWISENRRYDVLRSLIAGEGIEEVVALVTYSRTEFFVWASDPAVAANSLLHFLTADPGLKLSEWEHFCRLLDEAALAHIFRVVAGLDSRVLGEPEIEEQTRVAFDQARTVGATGPFLAATLEKALAVAERVRSEKVLDTLVWSIPSAAVDLAREVFESLDGRKALLLGTGKVCELSAQRLAANGAAAACVISSNPASAEALALRLGGTTAPLAERWQSIVEADIVISCSGCPHTILTRAEAEKIAVERKRRPQVILDLAMPRDIDPEVRRVDGILLCDLDGLERVAQPNASKRKTALEETEKFVLAEAHSFHRKLHAENTAPTVTGLRRRLEEICRQELESFTKERGPFPREQNQAIHAITNQIIQKIASSLARELQGLQEREEQEQINSVVQRLFHLQTPKGALAGTRSENNQHEQRQNREVAIPH